MGGALPARRNVRALPDRVASPAAAKLRGGVAPAPVREGSFPNITEVMVNGPGDVFVEREGPSGKKLRRFLWGSGLSSTPSGPSTPNAGAWSQSAHHSRRDSDWSGLT